MPNDQPAPSVSVRRMWECYRDSALPDDADPDLLEERRRMFYAGAAAMYHGLMEAAAERSPPDARDAEVGAALGSGMRAFAAGGREGNG